MQYGAVAAFPVALKTPVALTSVAQAGCFREDQPFAVHRLKQLWQEQISLLRVAQEVPCSQPEAFGTETEKIRTPH